MLKNRKGFTLIELLVVIAIIALLSTIAVVSLGGARAKARDAKRVADVKQMQTSLEIYFNDNTSYFNENTLAAGVILTTANFGTVMPQTPNAPTPFDGTCATDNNQYTYAGATAGGLDCGATPTLCNSYELQFCLGANTGDLVAGPNCATPNGIISGACNFAN
ncbi:MAG: type II secretion system protein [Candidatus Kuenenbacteria bacterium]